MSCSLGCFRRSAATFDHLTPRPADHATVSQNHKWYQVQTLQAPNFPNFRTSHLFPCFSFPRKELAAAGPGAQASSARLDALRKELAPGHLEGGGLKGFMLGICHKSGSSLFYDALGVWYTVRALMKS